MAHRDVNEVLAGKRTLISRVARSFVERTGWIEYDDAVQIVSLVAWKILKNPPAGVDNIDGLIVRRGFQRLTDELRTGHFTGVARHAYYAGERAALSLNKPVTDGEETLQLLDLLPDHEAGYGQCENVDQVERALALLPERERFVIYMIYYEGLSQREVSELLGVTESRTSQLVAKAHSRMRPTLAA
jgi:RNA polymerase sigma factor (sigma-70 family)